MSDKAGKFGELKCSVNREKRDAFIKGQQKDDRLIAVGKMRANPISQLTYTKNTTITSEHV